VRDITAARFPLLVCLLLLGLALAPALSAQGSPVRPTEHESQGAADPRRGDARAGDAPTAAPHHRGPLPAELAIFRGEVPSAEQLAALSESDRLWLAAAQLPELQRAKRFLDLADRDPALRLRALIGAASALIAARPGGLVHDWMGLFAAEDDPSPIEPIEMDEEELRSTFIRQYGPLLKRLRALHDTLAEQARDPDTLQTLSEARGMLRAIRRLDSSKKLHIPAKSTLQVPAPRPTELELRWYRCSPETWTPVRFDRRRDELPEPKRTLIPAGGAAHELKAPPPGRWMLELRDRDGWRSLRPVLVSDLSFDALAIGSHVVVAVRKAGQVLEHARVQIYSGERLLLASGLTDARGIALVEIPTTQLELSGKRHCFVEVEHGEHFAQTAISGLGAPMRVKEELRIHAFAERPLYRRGDELRGRVYVRGIEDSDEGPLGRTMKGSEYRFVLWPESKHEREFRGRLSRNGIFEFQTEIPKEASEGWVDNYLYIRGKKIELDQLCRVHEFRRSPVLIDLQTPARLDRAATSTATLSARWSNGAAASAAPVTVRAMLGAREQELETQLDAEGRLRIVLPKISKSILATRANALHLDVSVRGPDGQAVDREVEIPLSVRREPTSRRSKLRLRRESSFQPRPGSSIRASIEFAAQRQGLAVLQLPGYVAAQPLLFDAEGKLELSMALPAKSEDDAYLHVLVEGEWNRLRFWPQRSERKLQVELLNQAKSFLPGTKIPVQLQVRDGAGRPRKAVLSAALVDERVLAIQEIDDISILNRFGRLTWRYSMRHSHCAPELAPWTLIGELMRHGMPSFQSQRWESMLFGGAAGPSYGSSDGGILDDALFRKNFRSSVGFVAELETDEQGRASYEVQLPDDLTTWRLRVVAVDHDLATGAARFELITKKPLSVEAALPRFVRLDDRIRTTPAVAGPEGRPVTWAAKTSAELSLEHEDAIESGMQLQALSMGEAKVELAVQSGALRDALQRSLPVQRNTVRESLNRAFESTAKWQDLQLPAADELDAVVIGAGRRALLASLRDALERYPYRCAEQTSSRLLALYGDGIHRNGKPEDALAQIDLEQMLARLGKLWNRRSLRFSWWPGQSGDPGISALVLHTLVELRGAGHELARYGWSRSPRKRAIRELATALDEISPEQLQQRIELIEHAIGLLRLHPKTSELETALQGVLRKHDNLPRGLMARAGLAFAAAGKRSTATSIAAQLAGEWPSPIQGMRLGEDPRVQRAFELRLRQVLALEEHPRSKKLEAATEQQIANNGFVNTWVAACQLHALRSASSTRGNTQQLPEAIPAELRIDGELRRIELNAANRYRVRVELEGKPRIELRGPAGRALRARLLGARYRAGASFAAIQDGLSVQRSILGVAPGEVLERGRVYRLAIEVRAEQAARYLVLRCPLPAGCEPQTDTPGVERHDDALILSLARLMPDKPRRFEIPVSFGFEGTVLWPPVHVHDMYGGTPQAYSKGERLRIGPARPVLSTKNAELRVLGPDWARSRLDALLRRALECDDADQAENILEKIRRQRLPLDKAACEKWLQPLFALYGESPSFRAELFDLPGSTQDFVRERAKDAQTPFEWACFWDDWDTWAEHKASVARWLDSDDALFARHLGQVASRVQAQLESELRKSFLQDHIRHSTASQIRPELQQAMQLAESLLARAERCEADIEEALGHLDELTYAYYESRCHEASGGAATTLERAIVKRFDSWDDRVQALGKRYEGPSTPMAGKDRTRWLIHQRKWKELDPEDWPADLGALHPRDVEFFIQQGERGRRYLLERAIHSANVPRRQALARDVEPGRRPAGSRGHRALRRGLEHSRTPAGLACAMHDAFTAGCLVAPNRGKGGSPCHQPARTRCRALRARPARRGAALGP
jgi:hypothetical protein